MKFLEHNNSHFKSFVRNTNAIELPTTKKRTAYNRYELEILSISKVLDKRTDTNGRVQYHVHWRVYEKSTIAGWMKPTPTNVFVTLRRLSKIFEFRGR